MENRNKYLHAVLLEKNGMMQEMRFSISAEGKYAFSVANSQLVCFREDQTWKAALLGNGFLSTTDGSKCNSVPLTDKTIINAEINDKKYTLYFEEDDARSTLFLPYIVQKNADIVIGRTKQCDVCYESRYISREHAVLRRSGSKWTIRDNNSMNGVFVNGRSVHSTELSLGDIVYIIGLYIIIGVGYISMNNTNGRVSLTSPKVYPVFRDKNKIEYIPPADVVSDAFYERKPRKKFELTVDPIEIVMPPTPIPKTKLPMLLRLGSSAVMGGRAIATGNYAFALTSLVFPTLTQGFTEKEKKEYENLRTERYRAYLQSVEAQIETEIRYEEMFLNDVYPELQDALNALGMNGRLWEVRKADKDFLSVRIGSGNIPMAAEKQFPPKKFELEPDFLTGEMYAIAEKPSWLRNVPITVSLSENWIFSMIGSHEMSLNMICRMIAYFAMTHAYDEVKMAVFADPEDEEALAFIKYLRHFWNNERTVRFFATNSVDSQVVIRYLSEQWNTATEESMAGAQKEQRSRQPAFLLFVLNKNIFSLSELFHQILLKDNYCGFSLITALDTAPKESKKLIDFRYGNTLVDFEHSEVDDVTFNMDTIDPSLFRQSLRQIAQKKLRIEDGSSFSLPSMLSFLEMYGVGKIEYLDPIARWRENDPVKSLSVPIGVGTDGNLFYLDLHEKRQGPHGLIAGMTGSGKSEFIITYILSLAVNFSPEEVAFVLIDYKGGGLADAFVNPARGIRLPHVAATITNLDGAAIQRSLLSIQSELKRRQEVFKREKSENNEGTMDIYDYQKLYRNGRVREPMPHLFIISDEFAELKKQQPEFLDALISASRIGRSLGVHLILATQKPGGVVNEQIWSNTKFRVCLRVQDRGDSMEMLKRQDAAELKDTGRFYLQIGFNEYFALGQSAWCGAGYYPQEGVSAEQNCSVDFVDTAGQTLYKATSKTTEKKAQCKQIVAIVQYLSDIAKRQGIEGKQLWHDPLPHLLEYNTLERTVPEDLVYPVKQDPEADHISAVIGLVDDPERQRQFLLRLDLQSFHHMMLCGESGSGKSTFLRTLLYSIVTAYTPEEAVFYILDLSGGALNAFSGVPHCGAYLTEENESDFTRLLAMLHEIVEERKKLFARENVFGYDAYLQIGQLPLILVVCDGWTNIHTFRNGAQYNMTIGENMREASNYGIRFLFTVNHANEINGRSRQEIDYHIALRAKDKFDYNDILNLRGSFVPTDTPGRGLCAVDGQPLEYQVAVPNCSKSDRERIRLLKKTLAERSALLRDHPAAKQLPVMDDKLEYHDFCKLFACDRLPLGFSKEKMTPVAMPLQQLSTAGVFFGNPLGIKPVLTNLLYAFRREEAEALIVRRKANTVFDREMENVLQDWFPGRYRVYRSEAEELSALLGYIVDRIKSTMLPHRDAYCDRQGIPEMDQGRTKKAARYIREHSKPIVVIFESFADLCAGAGDDVLRKEFEALFSAKKGYNVYYFGCFYPDDPNISSDATFTSFMADDFAMLFGGRFHAQRLTALPFDYTKIERILPAYHRFLMKYHGECHSMIMPCGALKTRSDDPDESDII